MASEKVLRSHLGTLKDHLHTQSWETLMVFQDRTVLAQVTSLEANREAEVAPLGV